ncbi:ADP-ribosylglycohydrolase family protein [Leuconostoc rapi]|uniref:ADP-ribosylglycohydrolase family protein n=1 Tax=Leuconostoc rapi TaxID=1406906 RepID=UPI00195CFE35|nr:ADP-ribosylglycohydrolase family protein [Leuconostoc rapi]MBM7435385.1 ADP-ribosylglycohydrolase [Leuconostoc rapi]
MAKKQSTIQSLMFGMAVGESMTQLTTSQKDNLLKAPSHFNDILSWGSQTSLALTTIASLSRGYQLADVMNHFQNWYKKRQFAPEQTLQRVDEVTKQALENYNKNRDTLASGILEDTADSENILVRMLPVALYLHHEYGVSFINDEVAMLTLHRIAGLTHNDEGALVSVGMLSLIVSQLLDGQVIRDAVENGLAFGFEYYSRHKVFEAELSAFEELNLPDFANIPVNHIKLNGRSANTLEAIIWSLLNSNNYTQAIENAFLHGHANSIVPTVVSAIAAVVYREDLVLQASQHLVARKLIVSVTNQAERLGRFN